MEYIGQTQGNLKDRMNQHFNDVKKVIEKNSKESDSFASHFAEHMIEHEKVHARDVRALTKIEIMWQGNPIACMKSFNKMSCRLCMKE